MAKNKDARPDWFKFWRRNRPVIVNDLLPMSGRGKIMTNIFLYCDGEELLPMNDIESIAWASIKANIDESFEDIRQQSETNRQNVMRRWGN